jgi:uncharacterized membrane protein YhaH (DUF805 family)
MSARNQTKGRRRRKTITLSWIAALAILVIALIYWEQTAVLYILATLGVTALLVVVAMADLHGSGSPGETTSTDQSVGAGAKLRSTFGA